MASCVVLTAIRLQPASTFTWQMGSCISRAPQVRPFGATGAAPDMLACVMSQCMPSSPVESHVIQSLQMEIFWANISAFPGAICFHEFFLLDGVRHARSAMASAEACRHMQAQRWRRASTGS